MTVVYALLVAHFLGDFVAQSDWMALNKAKRWDALAGHVSTYTIVLIPFVYGYGYLTLPRSGPEGAVLFLVVNFAAHFVQDAITSRLTSRLWFFQMHEGVWAHLSVPTTRGTAIEKVRLYNPSTPDVGNRHWFFVAIGFDQLLHYVTLLVTAGWWLQ
jgi:hypothetical protein